MNKIFISILILLIICFLYKKIELFQTNYAQMGQDLKVLKFFDNKREGYFVEVGANDGIRFSNTYLLEKDYDWKGICIEPVPSLFKKLSENRKSINISNAIYNENDKIVNIIEANMLSGIREDVDSHKHILDKEEKNDIKVLTKTLTTVLNENNAPNYIEYLSIDTEGSELKVLEGIDFNKYKFGYINIEHNFQEKRRFEMRKLLESKNYKFLEENHVDDIYIYNEL